MKKSAKICLILLVLGVFFLSSCVRKPLADEIKLLTPLNKAENQSLQVTLQWERPEDMIFKTGSRDTFIEYYRLFLAMTNDFYREPIVVWVTDLEKNFVEYKTDGIVRYER